MTLAELGFDSTAVTTRGTPTPTQRHVTEALLAISNMSVDALIGTGDLTAIRGPLRSLVMQESWTNSGVTRRDREPSPSPTATALHEIKQIAGLTWAQVAQFLGVDRRSVHAWAAGGRMSAGREEQLYRLLNVARAHVDETPQLTRRALFEAVDLLRDEQTPVIRKIGIRREMLSRRPDEPHFVDLLAPPD